jgi:hypothetical protein
MVIQNPETGLVTGVFRAIDEKTHEKAIEKLQQGRLLQAVEQHFQLQEVPYDLVQHTEPNVE